MTDGRKQKYSLRLCGEVLDGHLDPFGFPTDDAKARFLGMSPSSLSRLRAGLLKPGPQFIAAVGIALPGVPLIGGYGEADAVFEIFPVTESARAAA